MNNKFHKKELIYYNFQLIKIKSLFLQTIKRKIECPK